VDVFTREKRSEIMSKIRPKWTGPERRLHAALKGNKVRHRMHPRLYGRPDAVLTGCGTAVFVDGCFWHGCPRHHKPPKTNKRFWRKKVDGNIERDGRVNRYMVTYGIPYVRIWECELEDVIKSLIERSRTWRG
jgi:DNA mismatch endonuclease, patch repair protein